MKTQRTCRTRALVRSWVGGGLLPFVAGITLAGAACTYDYGALSGTQTGTGGSGGGGSGGTIAPGSGGAGVASGGAPGTGGSSPGSGGATTGSGGRATGGAASGGSPAGAGGASGAGGGGVGGAGTGGGAYGGGAPGSGGASVRTGGSSGAAGTGTAGAGPPTSGGTSGSGGSASAGASGAGGTAGAGGAAGGPAADPDLVLWYRFEEMSGIAVADSATAAGTPHPGMLATYGTGGDAVFSVVHQVGARSISLTANGATGGGYVIVPTLFDLAPSAVTLSIWVQVTTAQRWQRVFDFGNTTTTNMALTTQDLASDSVRFVIRNPALGAEQIINTTAKLTLSAWHHLVVVLREGAPYTGELYIDGVLAGQNAAMTMHPADLGVTVNNFLGRSQFPVDPFWSGLFDDFRVYRRALSAAEIGALMLQR